MARNGSGTYSLPEDAFVFDTVIDQGEVNSNFSDIATEITNSIDKDGQTPITGILQHSVTVGQTANTGSAQGGNVIATEFYEIAVVGSTGDAVTLPVAVAGLCVTIVNNGANAADVFPSSGDKIDGGSANAAISLASGENGIFWCQDGTDWDMILSSETIFSGKTFDLDANTLTGTLAEFNTALQSASFCSLAGSETLTNKTLTAPVLNDPVLNDPVLNDPTFDVAVNVTADAGSAQGGGAITATFVEISTVGTTGDSVTLPTAAAGKLVFIANNGANSADVFPASGDKIDGGSVNVALALDAGANRIYICQDGTDWDTIGGGATELSDDTSPQLSGMLDVNGQALGDGTLELLKFSETGSAINEFTIANAASGSGPTLSATGDGTNVDINIAPKGTGDVVLAGDTVKVGDSGAAATLTSNGAGVLTVTTGGATDLVLNTNSGTNSGSITIADAANGTITIACNGTGIIDLQSTMNPSLTSTGKALILGF